MAINPTDTYPAYQRKAALKLATSGGEWYTVAPTSGAATTITISNLDTTADWFELKFYLVIDNTSVAYYLYPNSAATNTEYGLMQATAAAGAYGGAMANGSGFLIAAPGEADRAGISGRIRMENRPLVKPREFFVDAAVHGSTPGMAREAVGTGNWNDTTNLISSLQFVSNNPSGLLAGSYVQLWQCYAK